MVSGTSEGHVIRFSQAVSFLKEAVQLEVCSEEMTRRVQRFAEPDFDYMLCFPSPVKQDKPGVVFFRQEAGVPRILRIQF